MFVGCCVDCYFSGCLVGVFFVKVIGVGIIVDVVVFSDDLGVLVEVVVDVFSEGFDVWGFCFEGDGCFFDDWGIDFEECFCIVWIGFVDL